MAATESATRIWRSCIRTVCDAVVEVDEMEKRAIEDQAGDPQRLQEAHSVLDRRVKELERRAYLTPGEQHELTDLKKRKLALKDAIRSSQPPPEPIPS